MAPAGRNLREWQKHKSPLPQARVWQHDTGEIAHQPHVQDVEIERARPPTLAALAPEPGLDRPQRREQSPRIARTGLDFGYRVGVGGLLGAGRPGMAFPGRGHRQRRQTLRAQRSKRLRKQRWPANTLKRQVGAQPDQRAPIHSGPHMTLLERLIHPDERVALFIDGANLYSAAKALGVDLDYRKLLDAFQQQGRFVRAAYYTAIAEDQDFSPIRPLVDWLDYNGYGLVTKPAKEYVDASGRRRFKGDMDVEIAVDLMEAAAWLDHAFLFSGDGDFLPVIEALKRKGVRVSVVSTIKSNPPMASDDIRRAADNFVDLADLVGLIGRTPRERGPEPRRQDDEDA